MKTSVGVFFGGASVEHEVSVISALQAIHAMDKSKYEIVPVYIAKDSFWYTGEALLNIDEYKNLGELLKKVQKINLVRGEDGKVVLQKLPLPRFGSKVVGQLDVAFPIVHGTFGEDGVLQGFFELLGLPYVGCDVLSSASGMDKVVMKQVFKDVGLPLLDYVWFYSSNWEEKEAEIIADIEEKLSYPVIVKPANLGSSVGISKASNKEELEDAIELALSFAQKVVVEKMVQNMTEVNCSVIGDYETAEASICEQVMGTDEFLSYKDKYQGGNASKGAKGMESTNRIIPAEIRAEQTEEVQSIAKKAFQSLGCSGVSRIDFLIDKDLDKVFVNEINTIPGSLSFYLWEPTGKPFSALTDELIQLSLKRERERERLTFSIDSNLFSLHGGAKGSKGGLKG